MQKTVAQGFRLSPQQQHVWWAQRAAHDSLFVVQARIDISGALDPKRLAKALKRVLERHEILRTTFPLPPGLNVPIQAIEDEAALDWSWLSLGGLPATRREAALGRLCDDLREIPFDLANGPLLRATLIDLDGESHALLLSQPALAADPLSLDLLAAEVARAYQGELDEREVLQYADLAEILHEWQGSPAEDPGPAFWREQDLSALTRVTLGPAARFGQPFRPEPLRRRIPRAPVEEAAVQLETTVPLILLVAWHAALHLSTGEEEIVVGTLFDGRTCEELEGALGSFARYLPVRGLSTADSNLTDLARSFAETVDGISRRQDFFSSESIERLLTEHGAAGWPFGFDYRRPGELPAAPGLPTFTIADASSSLDRFGLRLSVFDDGRSLRIDLLSDPGLFRREEAERLAERFSRVLDGLLAGAPLGEIDVLTEAERRQAIFDFNRTDRAVPADLCAHRLFEERVRRAPDAVALGHAGRTWTYAELNARANRLAHHLRASGVGRGSLVGLCLERSFELVAAVLGVLKAGAAYVPLDPSYPAERLGWMAEDAGLSLLLTEEPLRPLLEDGHGNEQDPPVSVGPDDLAYVIYTSGSTGRPKGVMIPHRGLVNYLLWARQAYGAEEGAGAPVHSAIGFDLTVTSLWVPLVSGTAVTLLDERRPVEALAAALRASSGFSLVKLTPAHLDVLRHELAPGEHRGRARALVIGGEALRSESVAPWREHAPDTRLINEYGPTEATVGCSVYEVAPGDDTAGPVPIGRPIANTRLYVVGPGLRAVPVGAPGELWIGGHGLARGYLGRPELTADRFVPDPFAAETERPGERLYRTGDRVRLRPDGQLEFLGRIDGQLKIRGFRVEPGEIEAALNAHPKVRECVVVAREDGGSRRLAAYLVPRSRNERPTASEIRSHLEERLPDYMVPGAFVHLDALPLTPNGKLDRRALPDPDLAGREETPYSPPRTLAEGLLAEVWAEVLGVGRVGTLDNFFHLGGDSIRGLMARVRAEERGVSFTVQQLFEAPTIRELARQATLTSGPAQPVVLAPFALLTPEDRERIPEGVEDAYPLAALQAGMLFHSELAAGTAIFHDLHSFHLRAPLDEGLLRESVEKVALRHPVLRTAFDLVTFSEPLQLVYRGVTPDLTVHDLCALEAGEQEREIEEWLRHERQRSFDWSRPPLLAFDVHRRSDESFQLTMSFHHSILDGWSSASLLTELFRRYVSRLRGEAEPPEPPLTTAFRDLVALERETLASDEAREFWRERLADLPRTRLPRLPIAASSAPEARAVVRDIPSALSDRLKEVARAADVPLKSVLLAAHLRVLSLLGSDADVTTGLTSHGRLEHADGERALGLFLNTLPFRMQLDPGSWLDLARHVFARERDLFPFRRFPLAELQRLEGGEPLFEISFTFIHFHVYQEVGNVEGVAVLERGEYEETDFLVGTVFSLDPLSGALRLRLEHRVPEIGGEQAEAICGYYLQALETFAGDPNALFTAAPLLSDAEMRQLASWGHGGPPASSAGSVLSLFMEQARRAPQAVALAWEGGRQSYAELNTAANRLARHLLTRGVGPEQRVGLCLERSPEAIVSLLAVLKTGAAYVPLDPGYPAARLELLLQDAAISVLLSTERSLPDLPHGLPANLILVDAEAGTIALQSPEDPEQEPEAGNLAYVIFTSGSTGRPKGVLVEHGGLANLALAQIDLFGVKPGDRVLQFASLGFDASVSEIWMALLAGAELHLAEAHRLLPGPDLLALLAERRITHLTLPPSVLAVLPAAELPDLEALVVAGEACPPDLARLWRRSGRHLFNAYGPTEATVCATAAQVEAEEGDLVPIGQPLAGTRALLLDRNLSPVPVGVPGEICVGGAGLARGYLGQPALTAERFGPDPFCGFESAPGERIYHTGDLGRWLPGGALDFLGRIDHQVKVRGFRIEPGEIRAALLAHPGLREAAVIPREDVPGDLRLVAYVVPRPEESPSASELRGFLQGRLPDHMIPAAFVPLAALPLTSHGKLDRRALPAPGSTEEPGETFTAPRTPVEEVLAGLWAGLLGRERIGVQADFFDLGGHSLLATRLIARVRSTFDIDLPLSALFQAPTLGGFAAAVEDTLRSGGTLASLSLEPAPRDSVLPLSFAQQRLWVIDQLEPGSPVYNIPAAIHLTGALDRAALAAAFEGVVARHEVLRTTFELAGDDPVQRIAPPAPVPLPRVDLSVLPEPRREAEARLLAYQEALRPFDLRRGPLLRLALLRLAEEEHVLLLALHHIVADAWSMEILIREVSETYSAHREKRPPHLAPLPVQYADFALWQRRSLTPEALNSLLRYWRERLAGAPLVLELPSDRPRPAVPSGRGGSVALLVPASSSNAMASLARREGATLFMTLLAAFGALLHRYTGRDDLVVGTDVANRDRVESENLIGFFVNQLALRLDTGSAPPFSLLLRQAREVALGAYAHKDLPFEKLVEELQPERDLSRNPVFQVALSLQNAPAAALELPGLSLGSPGARGGVARFDFLVSAREAAAGGLWFATEHSADLFDDTTAARLLGHLETLLTAAAAHPGTRLPDLPILSETERQSLLAEWNDPGALASVEVPVHRLFERQALRSPESIALVWEGRLMSYGELDAASNRLARHLRSLGVGPESRVALLLERSIDMVVTLLAVLKAGGAYVPIDPDSPSERIAFLLADSAAAVLVTEGDRAEALPAPLPPVVRIDAEREAIAALPAGRLSGPDDPASLAYVIYTSGSTGRSKGVLIPHANVTRLFTVTEDRFRFGAEDVWTCFHSFAFDFSVWEIWGALLYGGRLVVVPHWVTRSPEDFYALLADQSVTVLNQTPSAFQALVTWEQQTNPASELSLRLVIFGGEALNPGSLRPWFERHGDARPSLVNMYGITETTVHVTWRPISAADSDLKSSPIGGPLPDLRLYLLGADGNLVPTGVPGEIHVGGAGLARGYLGRPELTAERFVPNSLGGGAGERLYRSGDLARRRPDGAIEYLGRIDHQVKIRGFRIELGEIEAALADQPGVREAVVVARQDGPSPRLVAYVVAGEGEEVSTESLREGLLAHLPQYMVPAAFVVLPALPLTGNGKVDRRALPEPEAPSGGPAHATPRTAVEQVLAALWAEVLRVEKVGRHDNFFALGGDSILSIQISTRAQKAGVRITPRLLFQHQTVAELAAVANTTAIVEAEQGIVTGPAPLTPIQRWFFADDPAEPHHFNQAVLFETARRLDPVLLQAALDRLEQHHDALRLRFFPDPDGWQQVAGPPAGAALTVIDLTDLPSPARSRAVEDTAAQTQASFDLQRGPLGRALWIDFGPHEPGRFFWALHHLVVDGVSWRILLDDLAALYDGVELPAKTTSFRQWAERLSALAEAPETRAELSVWLRQPWTAASRLPIDHPEGRDKDVVASESSVSLRLDAEETRALLQEVPRAYNTRINDVLLAALAGGLRDWTGSSVLLVDLEGHGREEIFPDVDLSRTVGWFTTLYPVLLDLREASDPGACLKTVKEQLRRVPRGGIGYGLLRWAGHQTSVLAYLRSAEVVFNYLGQLDQALPEGSPFRPARESAGPLHSPRRRRSHPLAFDGSVFDGRLGLTCTFSTSLHRRESVEQLVRAVAGRLREIIDHCRAPEAWGYTPSDFPLAGLEPGQLDALVAAQNARPSIEDIYPLSPMQQGMLFHTLFAPQTYVLQISGRILGEFDREAFLAAWARLLDRHPILRTSFHWEGLPQPLQVVHRRVEIPLEWLDLSDLPESDRRERLAGALRQDLARGFHLGQAPLLRLLLLEESDQEHRLVWSTHLILMDGWSQATVLRELFQIYAALREGREPGLPVTPPYRDYIAWLTRQQLREAEDFWRRELHGLEGATPLPADRGPGAPPEIRQDRIQLSSQTTAALQALGRGSRLTLNTLLQGAWALLLARSSGNPEVVFGATVSGRPADLPGIESMVGLFINSLPVRVAVSPQARLLDWLSQLQDRQTAARQYDHVPLVDIQGWSPVPRGTPLFESLVVFENYPAEEALSEGGGPGLQVDEVDSHEVTHYPLVLIAVPGPQLTLRLFWDRSRFSAESIQRLLLELTTICEAMARQSEASLAEIDPLPEWERHQILVEWNDTAEAGAGSSIHSLFEAQAKRRPDAVAITAVEESVTYEELHRRAGALAHHLRALGVGPEIRVALCLERTPDLVEAILGVLAAGGAYVPLDPSYPRERLAFLLEDSGASLVVTERRLAGLLPEGAPPRLWLAEERGSFASRSSGFPADVTDPENLAYLIYTSGSTGRPKGVAIAHRGAAALVRWTRSAFSDAELAGVLASTSVCFDLSVFELLATLCLGGRVVLAAQALELPALAAAEVRLVNTVPSVLAELARTAAIPPSVITVCLAGEPLPKALVEEIHARTAADRVLNLYGPSEDTTYSTWAAARREGREPAIGRPISGTRAYVLDSELRPVPLQAVGELCLAGTGLARGYFGRPDVTARQFVPSPFGGPGDRLYRTGDLARFRPDGNLDFLGRIDQQVKIRGFRIELGEIEAALREEGPVQEAAVVAHDHPSLGRSLVAYVVPGPGEEVSTDSLRERLLARLPQHMVPAAFVVLPAMPLNRNGKIDRKALAQIVPGPRTGPVEERGPAEPQGRVERTIAAVWREILGLEQVGRHQSFFDLGGHSLLLIRVQESLARELGREISLVDLFRYPTVSALAGFLDPDTTAPALVARPRALPAQNGRIAVIGMAGRFPGASGIDAFWQNLAAGVESISFHTDADLAADGIEPSVRSSPHFVPAGGVLEDIELFDAPFFGYTPRDAEIADPQHRLFLECAWQALESAGYVPETCPGPVGVFAGASRSQYFWNLISNPEVLQAVGAYKVGLATDKDFLTTNVSYKLDLKGPSLSVQTACSTSLVAVHVACRSLLAGECDMALAGGASIEVPQRSGYLYQEGGIRSPDGHCRAFDARAQGTVAGSGVGVVLLKRLDDALADGDPVHAVILGSAINNDGSGKVGYTAPSVDGQAQVIRAALEAGGVDPKTIRYVEAHGTGTPLGDPIEVTALTQAFREAGVEEPGVCALGSVKTNIGHLDAASGVAGLIKTVLALEHRQIPPSLHFEAPNPQIDFTRSPFRVNERLREWPADGGPRRAGVSSFGIGGTNAHAVLEEAPPAEPGSPARHPWQLLVLSARTPAALEQTIRNLAGFLAAHPDTNLADAAWTLQTGRRAFEYRRTVLCKDTAEALAALAGPGGDRAEEKGVIFLFPGQGAQHPGMGLGLYRSEPVFREELDRAAEILLPRLGLDLRDALESDSVDWEDTAFAQPALFAVEHALARLWMSWGIRPEAMIGHSLGEYVAACLAGVFSFEDGLALVAERGRLLGELPRGAMASLPLSEEEAAPLLEGGLALAAVNGPAQCVVSGPGDEVRGLLERLAARGIEGRLLRTSHAFHSAMMEPAMAPFAAAVGRIRLSPPRLPWISNVTGTWISAAQATDPGYWANHLRAPVRFADGLATLLQPGEERPAPVLLEVGPGRTLSALARRHPGRNPAHKVVTSLRHPDDARDDAETVLSALGQLWSAGAPVDWRAFHSGDRRRRVPLPTYPFERRRYWIERKKGISELAPPAPARRELADWFWTPFWKPAPPVRTGGEARGPWLVFLGEEEPGGGGLGEALLDHLHGLGAESIVVRPGARPWRREDYDALLARVARERGSVPSRILHLGSASPPEPALGLVERLARLERETDRGFYSLLFLLQALGERGGAESFEITVVTACAQRVAPGDLPCPERAMMHALGLVAPREHAGLTCRAIDVGLPIQRPWLGRIAADIAAPFSEPLVAWRGGERWLPDVVPLRLEERAPLPEEGVWLITGGLGAIGLEIAEHLAASRARLVLVGRRGLPPTEEKAPDTASFPHLAEREIELRGVLGVQGLASRPGAQEALDAFTSARLLHFLIESGIDVRRGARLDRQDLRTALRLLPKFYRFLDFLLEVLAEDRWIRLEGDAVIFEVDAVEAPDPAALARETAARHPVLRPILERVERSAAGYGPALSGGDEALTVLFSEGDEGELAASLSYLPVYIGLAAEIAAEAAERCAGEKRALRVLEVGGGQGNLTRRVAPALAGRGAEYWFTDLGRLFVTEAEREAARAGLDFLRFGVLDASRDPVAQGYEAESFDLIFALNVVHATPDVEATLSHLRRLLRPGGTLCLIELTGRQRWVDMIWGLAEGWWLFSDAFRQGSPLLGLEAWREVLSRTGFEVSATLPEDGAGRADSDCGLLLATRPATVSPAARVRRLRELGAQVVVETADAAEAGALRAVAHRAVERFGRLDGVIHAAGVPGGGLLELRTRESLEEELSAKVRGALAVGEVCRELSPDHLVLFSSTSAFTGQLGQAGYCAANAFLDAWAHLHAAETGMATLTLDWDRWQGIGMAVEVERRHRELTGHELTGGISPAQGAEAFVRALASGRTQVIVSPEDFAARLARERKAPSVSAAVERQPAPASLHERPDLSVGYVPPSDELEREIAEIWQEVFAISRIGIEDDFFELGGDSLVALQLVSRLSESIGLELRVRNLFEAPTIAALASFVEEAMLASASEDELALTGGREALP